MENHEQKKGDTVSNIYDEMAAQQFTVKEIESMVSRSSEVTLQIMPKRLTAGDLDAVKNDPLSAVSDIDEMHKRIGWLICAYDAIVESRLNTRID